MRLIASTLATAGAAGLTLVLGISMPSPAVGATWEGPAALGVEIKDRGGSAVAGAVVRIRLEAGAPAAGDGASGPPPVRTDAAGTAAFGGLAEGEWYVEVAHPDFMSFTAYVVLRAGKAPKTGFTAQVTTPSSSAAMRVAFGKPRSVPPRAAVATTVAPAAPIAPAPSSAAPRPATPTTPTSPVPAPPQAPSAPAPPSAPVPAAQAPTPPATPAPPPVSAPVPAAAAAPPSPTPPVAATAPPSRPAPAPATPPAPTAPAPPRAVTPAAPAAPATPEPPKPPSMPAPVASPPTSAPPAPPAPTPAPPTAVSQPQPAPVAPPPAPAAPAVAAAQPAPVAPAAPPAPVAPAMPPVPGPIPAVRTADRGNCPECRPGESAVTVEASATAAGGDCEAGLAAARAAAATLQPAPAELAGSGFGTHAGPAAGSCQVLAILLPRGARYLGYRYEAEDNRQSGDCAADADCTIGEARWRGHPTLERRADGTLVVAVFENRSAQAPRIARLTAYFRTQAARP